MAKKDRIIVNGQPQDFTCKNSRFATDITKGQPHVDPAAKARGNTLDGPLADSDGHTLWLEYVSDLEDENKKLFWLMWYRDGIPTIPMSGVMTKNDLCKMSEKLEIFCKGPA
ncbi:MAG TPA: hypothetical protein VK814_08660 [Acidobacteriaceae bacterium]|nr:hypothetical protein [Acidobacteriaceae bacterium]